MSEERKNIKLHCELDVSRGYNSEMPENNWKCKTIHCMQIMCAITHRPDSCECGNFTLHFCQDKGLFLC